MKEMKFVNRDQKVRELGFEEERLKRKHLLADPVGWGWQHEEGGGGGSKSTYTITKLVEKKAGLI